MAIDSFRRASSRLERVAASLESLGVANTSKVFLVAPFTTRSLEINLPNHQAFSFRGRHDRGVISHFYTQGYCIQDRSDKRIKRIIDCGANIGTETARFRIHHPQAQIVAVEAERGNFDLLQKNFSNDPKIVPIHGAIWPEETTVSVIPSSSGSMESFRVVAPASGPDAIPAWPIPRVMALMAWPEIDILKLDIEGAEFELFSRNYAAWIDRVNAFVFEVPDADQPGSTQAIYRALGARSFNTYVCGECLILIRSTVPWFLRRVTGFLRPGRH